MTEGRFCNTCSTFKPWEGFYRSKSDRSGHHPQCKECQKAAKRKARRRKRIEGFRFPKASGRFDAQACCSICCSEIKGEAVQDERGKYHPACLGELRRWQAGDFDVNHSYRQAIC